MIKDLRPYWNCEYIKMYFIDFEFKCRFDFGVWLVDLDLDFDFGFGFWFRILIFYRSLNVLPNIYRYWFINLKCGNVDYWWESEFSYICDIEYCILYILIQNRVLYDYLWILFEQVMFDNYDQLFIELLWFEKLILPLFNIDLLTKNLVLRTARFVVVLEN